MKKTSEQIARESTRPKTAPQKARTFGKGRRALARHRMRSLLLHGRVVK